MLSLLSELRKQFFQLQDWLLYLEVHHHGLIQCMDPVILKIALIDNYRRNIRN